MKTNEQYKQICEKRKKIFTKDIFLDLLLLLPPILVETGIIIIALTTGFISLFLTYFVLPMFYTVERRIRAKISGIGNQHFSYADGYKAFFRQRDGGIFGIILSLLASLAIGLLFYFIIGFSFPMLCNSFEGAREVYDTIYNTINSQGAVDYKQFQEYLSTHIFYLSRPLTILVGCILFVPTFYFYFYRININLTDHYLATIVLPDIDLNISASEARSLSRGSFRRFLFKKGFSYSLRLNWIYYLIYAVLYALTLSLFASISAINSPMMSILILATPSISVLYGCILNYFCLANEYAVLEVIAPELLEKLPTPLKESIYQTYINKSYIHGIESEIRGCFVPQSSTYQSYRAQEETNPFVYEPKQEEPKDSGSDKTTPQSGVFDFSDDKTDHKEDKQ